MTVIDALTVGGRTWLIHQTNDAGTWIEPIRRVSDIDDEENSC